MDYANNLFDWELLTTLSRVSMIENFSLWNLNMQAETEVYLTENNFCMKTFVLA